MNKWAANLTGHFHCNELHANDLSDCNRTARKISMKNILWQLFYRCGKLVEMAGSEKIHSMKKMDAAEQIL